jgi:hypothetical protein
MNDVREIIPVYSDEEYIKEIITQSFDIKTIISEFDKKEVV